MASKKQDIFTRFTTTVSAWLGRPWIFVVALVILILWAASGPMLGFSDTWQLVINTGTTIITFLMVFIIQNTQNRDNMALNIKLDIIMQKLNITEKDVIEAEDQSDKLLEKRIEKVKSRAESTSRSSSKKASSKTGRAHTRKKSR